MGSGGSSGIAGTAGMPSFGVLEVDAVVEAGGNGWFADGAALDGGAGVAAVDGHAGAVLSAASDVPFAFVAGDDWFAAPACGVGPSLIFTYRYAPTTTRIVIVTSGRIEPIDRPP